MKTLSGQQEPCSNCGKLKPDEGALWDARQKRYLCTACWRKIVLRPIPPAP